MEETKKEKLIEKTKEKKALQKKIAFMFYAFGSESIDKLIYYGSRQFTVNDFVKINEIRSNRNVEPLEFWDMFDAEQENLCEVLEREPEEKNISKVLVP